MPDWYVSSAAYATIPAFQAGIPYIVGNIVVPTAPALQQKWVFRCTTAGNSSTEPSWPGGNMNTVATGTVVFTNITGQSTYFWAAAAGDVPSIGNRFAVGDHIFISSDHREIQTAGLNLGVNASDYTPIQFLCVNRAGSTPPVATDLTIGATITVDTNGLSLRSSNEAYYYGITFIETTSGNIILGNLQSVYTVYCKNCAFYLNNSNTSSRIVGGAGQSCGAVIFDNCTMQFGNSSQKIDPAYAFAGGLDVTWINTSNNALVGPTYPALLIGSFGGSSLQLLQVRGVDLSGMTGTLVGSASGGGKYLFESCKIASNVTRYSPINATNTRDFVELVNCFDGNNIVSESYQPGGAVTTEFDITLKIMMHVTFSGGATDLVGTFSHKMVSNANVDKFASPLQGFWMDFECATGSKTATVEVISSGPLMNDEIALYVHYQGTSGSPVASFASSFISTPLTTPTAVTSSTAEWNSMPATPVKQKLQVTFTQQTPGRVRAQVRLGKANTTCYYNPKVDISASLPLTLIGMSAIGRADTARLPLIHRYWRILMINGSGNAYSFSEIQFRTATGTTLAFSGGTASAADTYQGAPGTYDASKATDGNTSTLYSSNNTTQPQWWAYDFGTATANWRQVVEIAITARVDGQYVQTPTGLTPQWSNDGSTWTSAASVSVPAWTSNGQTQVFAVT